MKENTLTKNERNNTISLLRMLATLFIIICHVFQYYNMEAAWWFNVGVQMFLCISGFLYGNKRITSSVDFVWSNIKKILIPYYCYLAVVIPVYYIFHRELLNRGIITSVLLTSGTIHGIEHLWFICYILLCYIMTPYLQALADKMKTLKWYAFLGAFLVLAVLEHYLFVYFNSYFAVTAIFCYLFGYFASVFMHNYKYSIVKGSMCLLALVTIAMNGVKIYNLYVSPVAFPGYDIIATYTHPFLGIALVLVPAITFKNLKRNRLLELSDKYSFYIYIVHQIYILGPFTLLTATDSVPVNLGIVVVLILVSAVLLKFIADHIARLCSRVAELVKSRICSV